MKRLAMAAAMVVGMMGPVGATELAWTLPQPEAPVAITDCFVGPRGDDRFYLDLAARFKNKTNRDIAAVRLRFDVLDPFNAVVKTVRGTDDDMLHGGEVRDDVRHNLEAEDNHRKFKLGGDDPELEQTYLPTWEFVNSRAGSKYICSVDTAKPVTPGLVKAALATTPRRYPGIFYKSTP